MRHLIESPTTNVGFRLVEGAKPTVRLLLKLELLTALHSGLELLLYQMQERADLTISTLPSPEEFARTLALFRCPCALSVHPSMLSLGLSGLRPRGVD